MTVPLKMVVSKFGISKLPGVPPFPDESPRSFTDLVHQLPVEAAPSGTEASTGMEEELKCHGGFFSRSLPGIPLGVMDDDDGWLV